MEKGEKTLVKRAMRGNPKAFGTLVEREQEYLYRMAFLYVRQEQDALDVVQESILKAYKSLKTPRTPCGPGSARLPWRRSWTCPPQRACPPRSAWTCTGPLPGCRRSTKT